MRLLLLLPLLASGGAFNPLAVERGELDPALAAAGWQLLTKRDVAVTEFSGSPGEFSIVAHSSNALMFRLLGEGEQQASTLAWSWQLVSAEGRDNGHSDGQTVVPEYPDWPAAVYVAFAVDPAHESWWQRFKSRWQFRFAGLPRSGRILVYTWEWDEPPVPVYPNPYIPDTATNIALRVARTPGEEFAEKRDVRTDFEQAYGYQPGDLVYIAVSADSEDTASYTHVMLSDLTLSSAE